MIDIRSFRDLVRLFYIFRREFLLAFWVTLALAVAGAFLLPPKYISDARLLVKPGRENLTVPIDVGDRQTVTSPTTQRDPIIDEEKLLTGRPVVMKVARAYLAQMGGDQPPEGLFKKIKYYAKKAVASAVEVWRSFTVLLGLAEPQLPEDRLADKLADAFVVSHGVGSNVMELHFIWDEPTVAQKVMQLWVQAYLEERTAVLGRQSLVTFYENKVTELSRQIEVTKGSLRERLAKIDGLSAQERLETLTRRLNDLRTRRSEIVAERDALTRGVAYATGRVGAMSRETVLEREVGAGPTWLSLNGQLSELKRQRLDLLRVYKEGSPAITSLDESIAEVEKRLAAEERTVLRSEKSGPNELHISMERSQLEKSLRLQELETFAQAYDKELTELEAQRRKVLDSEPELASLEQALVVAERSRALSLDSLEKARVDQALDESRIHNIAVIEAATFNPARVSPKSLLLLLAAVPAGAMVGLLVVYLCSLFDQRIHDGGRIEQRFGVPLWSTIKDISSSGEDNDFHASLYRIYGMLPLARVPSEGLTVGLTSSRPGEGVSFLAQRLQALLKAQGLNVRLQSEGGKAAPGEVLLLDAAALLSNREAFVSLGLADVIVLVVEARASGVPVVDNALGILRTAYQKVDGVIVNRRRFEVPPRVLRFLQR
jgi:uncharacterized protein involved in exopolysaccharide biosynthesis